MKPPYLELEGYPSRTISIVCTDLPQTIPVAELIFEGNPVISMLVSCESNTARFTFGDVTPDITAQVGHTLFPGYFYLLLRSSKAVRTFQFCNANAAPQVNAIIHITLFFERQ